MAYIVDDDKQNDNGQAVDQSQQGQQLTSTSGGASAIVNTGEHGSSNTAGMGAGGSGGWVNIQSYLDQNQNSQAGSAALAKQKVGSEFQNEQSRLATESAKAKNDAASAVNNNTMDVTAAKQKVGDLSKEYSYKGSQSDAYNTGVNQVKSAANYQYGGPTSYNYALNSKAQGYGDGLKDDNAWSNTMNALYGETANGQLSQGQQVLQTQLDVNNPYLAQARADLGQQYSGLQSDIATKAGDADSYVKSQAALAQNRVADLNSYLGLAKSDDRQALQKAVTDFQTDEARLRNNQVKNKEYASGGPRGTQLIRDMGQTSNGTHIGDYVNFDNFYTYRPAGVADETNVSGVNAQRNEWNTINDILGGKEAAIKQADVTAEHGKYYYDDAAYKKALAAYLNGGYKDGPFSKTAGNGTVETQWD